MFDWWDLSSIVNYNRPQRNSHSLLFSFYFLFLIYWLVGVSQFKTTFVTRLQCTRLTNKSSEYKGEDHVNAVLRISQNQKISKVRFDWELHREFAHKAEPLRDTQSSGVQLVLNEWYWPVGWLNLDLFFKISFVRCICGCLSVGTGEWVWVSTEAETWVVSLGAGMGNTWVKLSAFSDFIIKS